MAPAQYPLRRAPPAHCSPSRVRIGLTRTVWATTHSTVRPAHLRWTDGRFSSLAWTTNATSPVISAFSTQPNLQIRLPAGDVYLTVHIRDTLYCVSAVNLSAITVQPDTANILDFIARVQGPRSALTTYPLVQLLSSGNQNTVGQLITSICQELNKMYNQLVTNAVSRERSLGCACLYGYDGPPLEGLTATSIFVSPLGSSSLTGVTLLVFVRRPILLSDGKKVSQSPNASALLQYSQQLNILAAARDFLVTYTSDLAVGNGNSMELQAATLVQLTQATDQLTRSTLVTNAVSLVSSCISLCMCRPRHRTSAISWLETCTPCALESRSKTYSWWPLKSFSAPRTFSR